MGHRRHARVVINGKHVYNLGGDTCKQLKCQADCKDWEPLTKTEWPLVLGTAQFKPKEIQYITLIIVTRTPGRKRRIDHIYQYVYGDGVIDRFHAIPHQYNYSKKWQHLYCARNSFMYKVALNFVDLSVKPGKDIMWKVKQMAGDIEPIRRPSLWDRFIAWVKSWFL